MSKIVLVVAAHTDDEALGCGGTIAHHAIAGDSVYAVFLADGVSSRLGATDDQLAQRNSAAAEAHHILGIKKSFLLGFPDNRLDSVPLLEMVQRLEAVVSEVKPNVIYTHHYGDLNIDHQMTHRVVMTACRPMPDSSVRELYTFEVVSSTEWSTPGVLPFTPNYFVNISETIEIKKEAIKAYKLEMRPPPHSRSEAHVCALATRRGNSIGVGFAEAFMVVRLIN